MIILEAEEEEAEEEEQEDSLQTFKSLQLSLCSMSGFTTSKSSKVEGLLQDHFIVILLDCGASHNFIATELVDKLNLRVQDTPYLVEVGDGHKVRCKGKCPKLKFQLQQLEIEQDFYLFTLKGVDIVLGLGWLAGLGEIKADFGKLELTVKQGGKLIKISGNPALTRTALPLGALMQILKEEGEGLMIHCESSTKAAIEKVEIPAAVLDLLAEFANVFVDPQGLPPIRRHDHAI